MRNMTGITLLLAANAIFANGDAVEDTLNLVANCTYS